MLRIFHVDLNFVNLRTDYLRRGLKHMAEWGYNAVLWEIENKVSWETCPECVWPEAMSQAEFRDLLAYSRSLGLEPIPLLQTVGHGEYVLQHDRYRPFRELPDRHDCYCTSHADVRAFLSRWVEEYMELFGPLRHFHLGGDEAYVFGQCPVCRDRIAATSASRLYAEHLHAVAEPLLRAGIRPGVWCDMLLHHPEDMQALRPEFVAWDWNYWDGCGTPAQTRVWHRQKTMSADDIVRTGAADELPGLLDEHHAIRPFHTVEVLKRGGREVILCSAARSAGDSFFLPRIAAHADNIAGAAGKAVSAGLAGCCVTNWAIRLNTWETQVPLLQLAPVILRGERTSDEALREVLPEERREAFRLISRFDGLWTRLSAVQWNGLKDSLPAPPGRVANIIADWKSKGDVFWTGLAVTIAETRASIDQGLRALDRATDEVAQAWREAGGWQRRYFAALAQVFSATPNLAAARRELTELKADYRRYLEASQTPRSAAQNAELVFDPLIEYLAGGEPSVSGMNA